MTARLRRRRSLPPPWCRCQADCRGAGAKARRRRGGDPRVPERVPERWRRAVSRLAPGSSAGQHRRGRRGGRDPVSAATKHGTGSPPSPPKPETTSGKRRLTPRGSRRADRILAAPFEPPVPAATQTVEVVAAHLRAVSVEVDPDLVPGAAPRAAALVREARERRGGYEVRLSLS